MSRKRITSSSPTPTLTSKEYSTHPRQNKRLLTTYNSLAGADRLAKRTNAMVVGNGEAITVMRQAGVPEENLLPVSGGERVPLFTRKARDDARMEACPIAFGPPMAPKVPDPSLATLTVDVWPSLHALMPTMDHSKIPPFMDSGERYLGSTSHACTLDITRGMTYGLLSLPDLPQEILSGMDGDLQTFVDWLRNKEINRFSGFDGGQLMYHFHVGPSQTLLVNSHLGGYEGILKSLLVRPTVAILGIAGRANLNGRPFDGSAAEFAVKETRWLGEPDKVIWCLHDRSPLNPKYINTTAAEALVEKETKSKVWTLEPAKSYELFTS